MDVGTEGVSALVLSHSNNMQLVDELESEVYVLQRNLEATKLRLEEAKKRCAVPEAVSTPAI